MPRPVLTFHVDPGHGWLEVPRQLVAQFGLSEHSFSAYSYCNETSLFLEEDCDAGTWIDAAHRAKFDYGVTDRHYMQDAPIRAMRRVAGKAFA